MRKCSLGAHCHTDECELQKVFTLERGEARISRGLLLGPVMLCQGVIPLAAALLRSTDVAPPISIASRTKITPTTHAGRRPAWGAAQATAMVLIRILSDSGSTAVQGLYVSVIGIFVGQWMMECTTNPSEPHTRLLPSPCRTCRKYDAANRERHGRQ